jgi:hypothetical protein
MVKLSTFCLSQTASALMWSSGPSCPPFRTDMLNPQHTRQFLKSGPQTAVSLTARFLNPKLFSGTYRIGGPGLFKQVLQWLIPTRELLVLG